MPSYTINLPWPDRRLNANVRCHWRQRARETKAARGTAFYLCKEAKVAQMPDAEVMFTFYPPDNRRRDIQNMPGMMKAYIDGIADAMGCDDHGFRPHFPSQFGATTPGGMVKVIVRSEAASVPIEGVVLPSGNVLK